MKRLDTHLYTQQSQEFRQQHAMGSFSRIMSQSFHIRKPTLTEQNLPDQTGRVFIVTGGYAGCGKELANILFQRNGTVYVAGRSKSKADAAIQELKAANPNSKGRLLFLHLDLADLTTIKSAVEEFQKNESRLDVLTNNAGVMTPPLGSISQQNHELQVATNVLGPFLFTRLLTPLLEKTARLPDTKPRSVRVTWAGSLGVDTYSPNGGVTLDGAGTYVSDAKNNRTNYGATKAGNVFLANEFARRHPFEDSKVISNAWNPGNLRTELQRHSSAVLVKTIAPLMLHPPVYGAYTELFAGWSDDAGRPERNGAYIHPWGRFGSFKEDIQVEIGKKGGKAEKLWDWCEKETNEYC